jgi:tetratricopeptide (TPR) repeat protein
VTAALTDAATLSETAAVEHWHRLAHTYGHAGRHEERLRVLLRSVKMAPQPEVWTTIGVALAERGRPYDALTAYAAARALAPERHRHPSHPHGNALAFHSANAHRRLGHHQQAIEHYRHTLRHDNENAAAFYGLSASLAHAAYATGDATERHAHLTDAHSAIHRAASLAPDNHHVARLREHINRALQESAR